MSYPDECLVFRGRFWRWKGWDERDFCATEWYRAAAGNAVLIDETRMTWAVVGSEVVPLTPAAVDLLAAIRQELGI